MATAGTTGLTGPAQGQYTAEQYILLAEQEGFAPAGAAVITAIGDRESGGDSGILSDSAVNPDGGAAGTLQFLPAAWPQLTAGGPTSCAENAPCALSAAYGISGGTNFTPWNVTQDMEPAGQVAYGDWEDSQAQANLANHVLPAIGQLGQDTPAFRQALAQLTPRSGGSGSSGPLGSAGGQGQGSFVNNSTSGGVLGDVGGNIIGALQSAYGQPFERVGIFLLGLVVVVGGLLVFTGGRGSSTVVNVGKRAGAAAVAA